MMYSVFGVLSLFGSFIAVTQAATGVCNQFPYTLLLPLSNFPAAESFCSSKFPLACTTTLKTTTTVISGTTLNTVYSTATTTTGILEGKC